MNENDDDDEMNEKMKLKSFLSLQLADSQASTQSL